MGFWDVVKIKADEYSKTAARKTNHFVEKTKHSLTLTEYEDKLKKLYVCVGEAAFQAYQSREKMPDMQNLFTQIEECNQMIDRLKAEIEALKS